MRSIYGKEMVAFGNRTTPMVCIGKWNDHVLMGHCMSAWILYHSLFGRYIPQNRCSTHSLTLDNTDQKQCTRWVTHWWWSISSVSLPFLLVCQHTTVTRLRSAIQKVFSPFFRLVSCGHDHFHYSFGSRPKRKRLWFLFFGTFMAQNRQNTPNKRATENLKQKAVEHKF